MSRIPITLITGFLGAGKTSFLNKIIENNKDLKLGVILNEFGDVSLESQFLVPTEDEVVELSNGCVCCVARGDLISAFNKVMKANPETNYIILEASGLSDPLALGLTFYNPSLEKDFKLDAVICVVDAVNFEEQFDNYDIARIQVSTANIILISKINKSRPEKIEQLKDLVTSLNPKALVYEINDDLDMSILIDRSMSDLKTLEEFQKIVEEGGHESHDHEGEVEHHHENIDEIFFKSEVPLDFYKFEEVLRKFPKNVIRAKGFLYFDNAPIKDTRNNSKKYLLQYVVSRKDYTYKEWDNGEEKITALLILGKDLNKKSILESLKSTETKGKKSIIDTLKDKIKYEINN
ncbi:MAG: GTP-binding protein [Candidatus Dojkabacteria bacterium]